MVPIRLSSYEFSTYRTGSGRISLRHRSYLLIDTNAGFRLSSYLTNIAVRLTLPDFSVLNIDSIRFSDVVAFDFDGKTLVHLLWLSDVTSRRKIKAGLGDLRIDYEFTFVDGHPDAGVHEHPAIVKPLPRYRNG